VTTNRIRDRLIVIIGDNVSPSGGAARWELYDAALGILSEFVLIPRADLPPVERLDTDASTGEYDVRVGNEQHRGVVAVDSDYDYRAAALVHLAIAEYRKANPPMPPVTDDAAYVEAERRYPPSDSSTMYPLDAVRTLMRGAFEDGAKWAAGRAETTITTTEVVEQLTKAAHETANAGIPARFFTRQAQAEAYQRGVDDWADEQGHTVPNPYAVPEEEL